VPIVDRELLPELDRAAATARRATAAVSRDRPLVDSGALSLTTVGLLLPRT
jgi:hypothetical protein